MPDSPPVHFDDHLAVVSFVRARMKQLGLNDTILAHRMKLRSGGSIRHLTSGETKFSGSRHFDILCQVLGFTPEEREAIQQAEHDTRQ